MKTAFNDILYTAWLMVALLGVCPVVHGKKVIQLADEHNVAAKTEDAFRFDLKAIPEGQQVRLSLDARNNWHVLGGNWPTMYMKLNEQEVMGRQLINKPLSFITRNGSDFSWAAEDKNRYRLVHAPDFSDETATDEEYEYGTPETDPFRFVWDITPYVHTGANVLKIQSTPSLNFTLCLRNVKVEIGDPILSKNVATEKVGESYAKAGNVMWDPSLFKDETFAKMSDTVSPAPTGPLPVYVPKGSPDLPSSIEVSSSGNMRFKIGLRDFLVHSRTSLPEGKWSNDIKKEEVWQPLQRGKSVDVKWDAAAYTVERTITLFSDRISVADTVRNTSDQLVGVIFENRLDLSEKPERILVAGKTIRKHFRKRSNPAHPTATAEYDNLAIGLVAEDDIFRIHARAFFEEGAIGLSDPKLGMAPGSSHTLEWSIYPCPDGDYWDFINAIRRNWGANRTLIGASKWETPLSVPGKVDQIEVWSQKAPVITLCNPRVTKDEATREGDENISVQHGTALLLCKTWGRQAREAAQRIREADANAKVFIYTHQNLCNAPDNEDMYQDSRAYNIKGMRDRTAYSGSHSLFVPTLNNSYGQALTQVYKHVVEELDADVYIDEITASNVSPFGLYDEWDECSVNIDPKSHAVKGKISSAVLLMQPWRTEMMEYLKSKGRTLVTANGAHYTRTMLNWELLQCFNESDLGSDLVVDLHLSHPLCLAQPYGRNTAERIQARYKSARGLLLRGGIQWVSFSPECPMFPITPIELHAGYIIGEERILTVRSGQFGWGDDSRAEVYVFDGEAKRVDNPDAREIRQGNQFLIELRIPSDHLAILVRKQNKGVE